MTFVASFSRDRIFHRKQLIETTAAMIEGSSPHLRSKHHTGTGATRPGALTTQQKPLLCITHDRKVLEMQDIFMPPASNNAFQSLLRPHITLSQRINLRLRGHLDRFTDHTAEARGTGPASLHLLLPLLLKLFSSWTQNSSHVAKSPLPSFHFTSLLGQE